MTNGAQRPPQRRRNRKRKRRDVSSSSSSSSSSGSPDSSDGELQKTVKLATKARKPLPQKEHAQSPSSSSSDSDDSDAGSSASDNVEKPELTSAQRDLQTSENDLQVQSRKVTSPRGPSPPPPNAVPAPQLLSTRGELRAGDDEEAEKEKVLKERFRKFWMASMVDAFADDLNEIRKEPNLSQSRLGMLIDSLASGADLYSSSRTTDNGSKTNEMDVILGKTSTS